MVSIQMAVSYWADELKLWEVYIKIIAGMANVIIICLPNGPNGIRLMSSHFLYGELYGNLSGILEYLREPLTIDLCQTM